MTKRFYETEAMFRRRCDREEAIAAMLPKKLWRIDAIEMKRSPDGSWRMGRQDHFTVEATTDEMALGVFKLRNEKMNWFVTGVSEETVVA